VFSAFSADIGYMQEIIIGLNSLIEMVQNFRELKILLDNVELQKFLATLELELAKQKSREAELIDENTELKDKIRKLQAVKKEKMTIINNAYYAEGGDGPYCIACYHKDGTKIPITDNPLDPKLWGDKKCPVCSKYYKTK
jgi:hypothetical protein